jgi:hypothetical protein
VRLLPILLAVSVLGPAGVCADDAAPQSGLGEPVRNLRQLTNDPGIDAMPSWSPDGRRIVFHSRRSPEKAGILPTRKIWIMNRDGTNAVRLSEGAADEYHPVFSPDGAKIAFVSEANGSRDIWIMDADGKNPLPLTDDPGLEDDPSWSPDGRQIAYVALPRDGGNFDLWIMNADGSGKRKLTSSAANEVFPAWHPQGRTIAFVTDMNGNFDIYGISLPDEQIAPILTGPANDTRPAWSPDGMALAFQRSPDGNWNLWSARLPASLLLEGRLRLARQSRGSGKEDVVKIRRGRPLWGTISTSKFRLRAPYGLIEVPRQALASIRFADIGKGTATLILTNGDTLSGLLLDDEIDLTTAHGRESIRKEKVEEIGFHLEPGEAAVRSGPARLSMRDGDSFTADLTTESLRLRVGSQALELPVAEIARVDFGEEGNKTRVVTRKGDTLGGTLETPLLEIRLPAGVSLGLYPAYVRTLTLTEVQP